jgi:hypothetical protein
VPNGEPTPPIAKVETNAPNETAAKPRNPFSREALRIDNSSAALLKTETRQHAIPVGKPLAESWVRVHPDPDSSFDTYLLQLKDGPDRGEYQVSADLLPLLAGEKALKPMRLMLAIDRQGDLRIWPLRLPVDGGREDLWMSSALEVAELAKERWVRVVSGANGYKSQTTAAELPEPAWPNRTFDELLDQAFAKKRISSMQDPILRRLLEGK